MLLRSNSERLSDWGSDRRGLASGEGEYQAGHVSVTNLYTLWRGNRVYQLSAERVLKAERAAFERGATCGCEFVVPPPSFFVSPKKR